MLLVDRVGELGAWWGTARSPTSAAAWASGNGQNMIEPAAYGCAVSFGPCTRNFRDVVTALLADDAAIVVHDGAELTAFVRKALEDPYWATSSASCASAVVAGHPEAPTQRTADCATTCSAVKQPTATARRSAA